MKIERVTVRPFDVPLRRTLESARGPLCRRDGFLLELTSDGLVGQGEASPAHWLGDEALSTTRAVLDEAPALVGKDLEELPDTVAGWIDRSAAAACALDTARLDLETRSRGMPLTELLGGRPRDVPVAALLFPSDPQTMAETAARLVDFGHTCLKVKVGARPVAEDALRLRAVRERCGATAMLRLDANRAWSLAEAERALASFAEVRLDYVEEPLRSGDPQEWARLREVGVALAADESLDSLADLERLGPVVDVVVLKAARLGGPVATAVVGVAARTRGLRVVVTDSIETNVGRAVAVHLATVLQERGDAVGLGGVFFLAEDPGGMAPTPCAHVCAVGPGLGI